MNDRLVPLGRTFLGVALVGLGVQQFLYGEFVVGRAPAWPSTVPGGMAWAWITGAFFVAVGLALATDRHVKPAALAAAVLVFVWALVRHVPFVATDLDFGSAWTRAGKALALTGGLLLAAGAGTSTGTPKSRLMRFLNSRRELEYAGRVALGLFLVQSGIQHFLFAEFVDTLVPSWIGNARFWTYFGGVALIAGGLGIMIPRTVRLAGTLVGAMIFTWFLILHIPRAVEMGNANEWIAVCEALAMSGIALMLAGFAHRHAAFTEPAVAG